MQGSSLQLAAQLQLRLHGSRCCAPRQAEEKGAYTEQLPQPPSVTFEHRLAMEVEYSGGGVLISFYLILIHQLDDLGGLCYDFGSDFIGCCFDGLPTACKRGLRAAS